MMDPDDKTDGFDGTPPLPESEEVQASAATDEDDGDIWRSCVTADSVQVDSQPTTTATSASETKAAEHTPSSEVPDIAVKRYSEEKKEEIKKPLTSPATSVTASRASDHVSPPLLLTAVDRSDLLISVTDPQKRGDGMGSYIVYKVSTTTTLPFFGGRNFDVVRRYSDFLGVYSKLKEKYASQGRLVPPPPEKNVVGTTMTKVSKEQDASSADFVNRRRAALERFLQRLGANQLFRQDPDFRDFLTQPGDLPKASDTGALSAAGVKRFFGKMTSAVSSVVITAEDPDPWFEERLEQVSVMENQLKKLVDAADGLQKTRHDNATGLANLGSAVRLLANAEENNSLSKALCQLAEMVERVHDVKEQQSDADGLLLAEQVRDYVTWLEAIRGVFEERSRANRRCKELEAQLNKKREAKARAEIAPAAPGHAEKVAALEAECSDANAQLERGRAEFEKMSETLRSELSGFELQRAQDFVRFVTEYLERLLVTQQQLIDHWTALLPEVKNIA